MLVRTIIYNKIETLDEVCQGAWILAFLPGTRESSLLF